MQEMVQRITESEQSKQGLIILQAWYGKLVSVQAETDEAGDRQDDSSVIDVTVPLQCQVKDSKLLLTDVSKVIVISSIIRLIIERTCVQSVYAQYNYALDSRQRFH